MALSRRCALPKLSKCIRAGARLREHKRQHSYARLYQAFLQKVFAMPRREIVEHPEDDVAIIEIAHQLAVRIVQRTVVLGTVIPNVAGWAW